jgi:hypothetical protein
MGLKKGQVTAFILIGLLLLVVVGFIFYVTSHKDKLKFQEEKEGLDTLFQKTGMYNAQIQSCVQDSLKQGIIKIGTQGGVIYDTQAPGTKPYLGPPRYAYGKYMLPFEHDDIYNQDRTSDKIIYEVSYGIFKPDLTLDLDSHPKVPLYPYGLTMLTEDPKTYDPTFTNMFGNMISSPLPPLCDYNGPNDPTQDGARYSCETYDSHREADTDSMQEYLQTFIEHSVEECVKIEEMPELESFNVQKGEADAVVSFAATGIDVTVDFALEVTGEEHSIHLKQFHASSAVRLKQIHELLTRLIKNDITNIFFDIQKDAATLDDCKESGMETMSVPCLKQNPANLETGMRVYKYRDVCLNSAECQGEGRFDDILVIEDRDSLINGKPFLFFIAIQNRIPALDFLSEDDFQTHPTFHYLVDVGDILTIEPFAYDPDEDSHNVGGVMKGTYIYSGWKEDYVDNFDFEECLANPENCAADPTSYEEPRDYNQAEFTFSSSKLFGETQKDASLCMQPQDRGLHTMKVAIIDNEGLIDYQELQIYVEQPDVFTPCVASNE